MADTIIKAPTGSGNKLVLQTGSGQAGIEVSDGADVLLHKKLTSGTLGVNVSVANCIIKKWHTWELRYGLNLIKNVIYP